VEAPVVGYRAPFFSITNDSLRALDVMVEEGIRYDSSVFPTKNPRYGISDAPRWAHSIDTGSGPIQELPISTAGAPGSSRRWSLLPDLAVRGRARRAFRGLNRASHPALFYLHPGLADRCESRVETFPGDLGEERFDASTAMGYFDYVENPKEHLRAIRSHTTGVMLMSFPKAREWRVPVRRLRVALRRVPFFLYREHEVRGLLSRVGIDSYRWIDLKRDYVVVARP
jgi:hypothetical protein